MNAKPSGKGYKWVGYVKISMPLSYTHPTHTPRTHTPHVHTHHTCHKPHTHTHTHTYHHTHTTTHSHTHTQSSVPGYWWGSILKGAHTNVLHHEDGGWDIETEMVCEGDRDGVWGRQRWCVRETEMVCEGDRDGVWGGKGERWSGLETITSQMDHISHTAAHCYFKWQWVRCLHSLEILQWPTSFNDHSGGGWKIIYSRWFDIHYIPGDLLIVWGGVNFWPFSTSPLIIKWYSPTSGLHWNPKN